MGHKERICTKCNKIKSLDQFDNKKDGKFGKSSYCIECRKIKDKNYNKNNKNKIREYNKKYREKNRNKSILYSKNYRESNKDKLKELDRKNYYKNHEKKLKKNKEYYEKNKDEIKKVSKRYREKNKDQIKIKKNEYYRDKFKNDHEFRMKKILKNRIIEAIRRSKGKKTGKTTEMLGCTIKKFKEHIESQFKDGMTWGNYGITGWHIDHIVPCAAFDLTDPYQQKLCFNYTNLQPLMALENILKRDKI